MDSTDKTKSPMQGDNKENLDDEDWGTAMRRARVKNPQPLELTPIPEKLKECILPDRKRKCEQITKADSLFSLKLQDNANPAPQLPANTNPTKKRNTTGQYNYQAQRMAHLLSNIQSKGSKASVNNSPINKKEVADQRRKQVRNHPETYTGRDCINEDNKQRNMTDRALYLRRNAELEGFYHAAKRLPKDILEIFEQNMKAKRDEYLQVAKAKDLDAAEFAEKSVKNSPRIADCKPGTPYCQTRSEQVTNKPCKIRASSPQRLRSCSPRGRSELMRKLLSVMGHRTTTNNRQLYHNPRQDREHGEPKNRDGGGRENGYGYGLRPGGNGGGREEATVDSESRERILNQTQTYVEPLYKWKYTLHRLDDDARDLPPTTISSQENPDQAPLPLSLSLPLDPSTQLPNEQPFVDREAANRRLDELTSYGNLFPSDGVVSRTASLESPMRLLRVDIQLASGRKTRLWVERQLVDLRRDIASKRERGRKMWAEKRPRVPHYVVEGGLLVYECVDGGAEGGVVRPLVMERVEEEEEEEDTDDDDDDDTLSLPDEREEVAASREDRRREMYQRQLRQIASSSSHQSPNQQTPSSSPSPEAEIHITTHPLPLETFTDRALANARASELFRSYARVVGPLRNVLDDHWWAVNAVPADEEARRAIAGTATIADGKKAEGEREGEGEGLYDAQLDTQGMRSRLGYDRLYVRVRGVEDLQGPVNI
ncbi:hypothetical protein F4810DRAFT_457005 [Camillea tinctor]|nr:hypothetical protein F4810DRAFT_457005 [Camillea tinctor]